jgi:hypothetical protein
MAADRIGITAATCLPSHCPGNVVSDGQRAGQPALDSRRGQGFSLLHNVRTGSGAKPNSCPVSTAGVFSGVKTFAN